MREFVKGVLILIMLPCVIVAVVAVTNPMDTQWPSRWPVFWASAIVGMAALGIFLKIHCKRDVVPDFLSELPGGFFERDGFCFALMPAEHDGECFIEMFFQTRYENGSRARVAIRPAKGLLGRGDLGTIALDVVCEPAGAGVARIPLPIPAKLQGKKQKFDVGASVEYPDGKGKMVRFRDGKVIRGNAQFNNPFGTALTVAAAAGGAIIVSSPASVTVRLPEDVAEKIPDDASVQVETLWSLDEAAAAASSPTQG